ncbi:Protein of unknown function [Pyronema omphalodes CBS 100304]|uniref:Uncharacterized protein n=1 Tax=Pyronema omphalodes (strain CBS 100304) TaxID=1076935 RepID=U4L1T7_PYROM|nr:Protein of unknown function [Pyronema omphalodes CBS 100304]
MEEDDGLVRWKPYGEKEIIFSVNFAATILFRSSSNSRFLKSIFPKLGARNRIYEDY